jgi:hypothetical protein
MGYCIEWSRVSFDGEHPRLCLLLWCFLEFLYVEATTVRFQIHVGHVYHGTAFQKDCIIMEPKEEN